MVMRSKFYDTHAISKNIYTPIRTFHFFCSLCSNYKHTERKKHTFEIVSIGVWYKICEVFAFWIPGQSRFIPEFERNSICFGSWATTIGQLSNVNWTNIPFQIDKSNSIRNFQRGAQITHSFMEKRKNSKKIWHFHRGDFDNRCYHIRISIEFDFKWTLIFRKQQLTPECEIELVGKNQVDSIARIYAKALG